MSSYRRRVRTYQQLVERRDALIARGVPPDRLVVPVPPFRPNPRVVVDRPGYPVWVPWVVDALLILCGLTLAGWLWLR